MDKFTKNLTQNLSRVILGLLALLLGVAYWFKIQEKSFLVPATPPPSEVSLDDVFPTEEYEKVQAGLGASVPIEESPYQVIWQFNMFDRLAVNTKEEDEKKANDRFAAAQEAFGKAMGQDPYSKEDLALAKEICREILFQIYPPHI